MKNEIILHEENEDLYIQSTIVAKGFGVEHKSLSLALQKTFSDLKSLKVYGTGNHRPSTVYLLTEREIAILPAVIKTTEQSIQFQIALVDAFFHAREKLKTNGDLRRLPKNYLEALEVCIISEKENLRLEAENKQLTTIIDEQAPKVDYFNNIIDGTDDLIDFRTFALSIGLGRTKLMNWMRACKYLNYNQNGENIPYKRYIDLKLFEVKETKYKRNGKDRVGSTTYITQKGKIHFYKVIDEITKQIIKNGN